MNIFAGGMGKTLKAFLSLAAVSLLLSACTSLDSDSKSQSPSVPSMAEKSPALGSQVLNWDNCMDPIIKPGQPSSDDPKLVAAILVTNNPGSSETSVLFDEQAKVSIDWDADGPSNSQFNARIAEAIGYSAQGSTGEPSAGMAMIDATKATGTFVLYKGIEPVSVPVSISCGENLKSTGVVKTWKVQENGVIECAMPGELDQPNLLVPKAKKRFCPKE